MANPGSRVGAIRDSEDGVVHFFGFGTYVGDETDGPMAPAPNPKIQLDDNRGVVWGCECWWGAEERIKSWIGNQKVILVDPPVRT